MTRSVRCADRACLSGPAAPPPSVSSAEGLARAAAAPLLLGRGVVPCACCLAAAAVPTDVRAWSCAETAPLAALPDCCGPVPFASCCCCCSSCSCDGCCLCCSGTSDPAPCCCAERCCDHLLVDGGCWNMLVGVPALLPNKLPLLPLRVQNKGARHAVSSCKNVRRRQLLNIYPNKPSFTQVLLLCAPTGRHKAQHTRYALLCMTLIPAAYRPSCHDKACCSELIINHPASLCWACRTHLNCPC